MHIRLGVPTVGQVRQSFCFIYEKILLSVEKDSKNRIWIFCVWYGIIKSERIDSEKYKEGDTVIHHNQLGEKLRNLRKGRDLTQEQLAERFGVSFQAISKWENGISHS